MTRAPLLLAAWMMVLTGCGSNPPIPGGACRSVLSTVPNEPWIHHPSGELLTWGHNPPASGPHYPVWAKYQRHTRVIPRGNWVHNLEHGGIVFLYRSDAPPEMVTALAAVYDQVPLDTLCLSTQALMTEDPELDDKVAIVAADNVLEANCVQSETILTFVTTHRGHGPEAVCADGQVF